MQIFGPLPCILQGIQYVLFKRARYSKLKIAVLTSKTVASRVANLFRKRCIISFGMRTYPFTDNGPEFVRKFFQLCRTRLEIEHIASTLYLPRTQRRAERINKTTMTRLMPYLAEKQRNWNIFMQPFKNEYKSKARKSVYTSPYDRVLSCWPRRPLLYKQTQLCQTAAPTLCRHILARRIN